MEKPAYLVDSVRVALSRANDDGKTLFEMLGQDRVLDSRIRSKLKGKKPIDLELLRPLFSAYPPFKLYLEEAEQAPKREAPTPASGSRAVALESEIAEIKATLERLDTGYQARYLKIMEILAAGGDPRVWLAEELAREKTTNADK